MRRYRILPTLVMLQPVNLARPPPSARAPACQYTWEKDANLIRSSGKDIWIAVTSKAPQNFEPLRKKLSKSAHTLAEQVSGGLYHSAARIHFDRKDFPPTAWGGNGVEVGSPLDVPLACAPRTHTHTLRSNPLQLFSGQMDIDELEAIVDKKMVSNTAKGNDDGDSGGETSQGCSGRALGGFAGARREGLGVSKVGGLRLGGG